MVWTLVTGGAKGVGAEICRTLAKLGYSIVVHFRTSSEEADSVVAECRDCGVEAEKIYGDFASTASIEDFLDRYQERFSDTENLINNVGNFSPESALEMPQEEWNVLFQSNLFSPIALIKRLTSSIIENRGCIVTMGMAGAETVRAYSYATAYQAAKMSLLVLTKSLAAELASDGVRVNMVSPGVLDYSVDLCKMDYPMGRKATVDEVARVVAFLLNKKNSYITGQNIEVAGGVRL